MPVRETCLHEFLLNLTQQGNSCATAKKYVREAATFVAWLGEEELTAERAAEYRDCLTACRTTTGANGAISALNKLFAFLGRQDCRLRGLPVQRRLCRDEGRELTQGEYRRLLIAARRRKRERLLLAMEAICATGIRVSELRFFTVEAVKTGKAVVTNKGKTREVYLPGKLCRRLREYARVHNVVSGPVLVTRGGQPLDRSNLWREMKALCREAKVSAGKVFPHNRRPRRCFPVRQGENGDLTPDDITYGSHRKVCLRCGKAAVGRQQIGISQLWQTRSCLKNKSCTKGQDMSN